MKPCEHPADQVKADILEGDYKNHQVQWCQQCGAFRLRIYDEQYHHADIEKPNYKNYYTSWIVPTFSIDPLKPVPELEGTYPVVLYFANKAEAEEFQNAVLAEKPSLKLRQL